MWWNDFSIYSAVFSMCEKSVPEGFEKHTLEKEFKRATNKLGIKSENLFIFRYPVRNLAKYRQDILQNMINIRNEITPKIVLLPNTFDIHQDHQVISMEGIRAFKNTSILGYEMPWNNIDFRVSSFVKLDKKHINKKVEVLLEYTSQQSIRKYMNRDFIESLAIVRGVQANTEYAEAFEVIKWII